METSRVLVGAVAAAFAIAAATVLGSTSVLSASPASPSEVASRGELVFNEDFDGASLDLAVWEPGWYADAGYSGPVNDLEDACYHPSQVTVRNGSLRLRATRISSPDAACQAGDGTTAQYVTGLVNTRKSFTFAYGYIEARIYLPGDSSGLHNWPAFWTAAGFDWPRTGEIDIVEVLAEHQPCSYYHSGSVARHRVQGSCVDWENPAGWHTFAADWQPGSITFYYDGVEVEQVTRGVVGFEHYIILDLAIDTAFGVHVPSTMLVDYVRVWETPTP